MARSDGVSTPIEPSLIQRVTGALSLIVTGKTPDWFGPSNPIDPQAPRVAVEGRSFDYPVAYNVNIQPKSADAAAVNFPQLRALADAYDILRLVIETRKDQIGRFGWQIVSDATGKEDAEAKRIAAIFKRPDGQRDFSSWLRLLVEDLLVIDAPTVFVNRHGRAPLFEVVDGATIKPLIDERGRRPDPPMGAFQQILKGVPAITYTANEIVYAPRNQRSHKVYGYSPVEQILATINIGLRRTTQQLEHFRSGSVPEMLIGTPDTWNPDQIRMLQEIFDARMSGNLAARAGVTFIPGGTTIHDSKTDAILKNDFDEWIARIVCYAFSVPPAPFVREMNRATAESAAEQSKQEGLAPLLQWAKSLIDGLIADHLKVPGYSFRWDLEANEDPVRKDDRAVKLYKAGLVDLGVAQDIAGVERHEVAAPPAAPAATNDANADDTAKVAKADEDSLPADLTPDERKLAEALRPRFDKAASRAVKAGEKALSSSDPLPADLLTEAESKALVRAILPALKGAAVSGVSEGASELAGLAPNLPAPLDVEFPAVAYARDRAAWLVGMKIDPETKAVSQNPNAVYRITDTMREALRSQVAKAVEEGWTSVKLAEAIRAHEAFSIARASNIARTEIAMAQEAGNMVYYKASGVVDRKKWSTANGDTCPRCVANEAAGAVALDAEFPSGHQYAPAHGHCRCRTIPVIQEGLL